MSHRELPPGPGAGRVNPPPTSMDLALLDAELDQIPFTRLGAYLLYRRLDRLKEAAAMSQRNQHAVIAQQGASNPIPLAKALVDGIEEIKAERTAAGLPFTSTVTIMEDPALRLIVHQLAHLFRAYSLEGAEYSRLCQAVGFPE